MERCEGRRQWGREPSYSLQAWHNKERDGGPRVGWGLDLGSCEGKAEGRWKTGRRWVREVDSDGGLHLRSCEGLKGETMEAEERWRSIQVGVAFGEL